MASHYYALRQPNTWLESPAKAFAKLKGKVRTEKRRRAEEPPAAASRRRGAGSMSTSSEFSDRLEACSSHSQAQALTLSPIPSPPRSYGASSSDSQTEEETPDMREGRRGREPRAFLESTAVSHPFPRKPPQIRDFTDCNASEIQGKDVFPGDMQTWPRKRVLRPRQRKTSDDNKKRTDYNTPSKFTAEQRREMPVNPAPRGSTSKRCSSVLDEYPEQMFTYVCEKENQRKLQRDPNSRTYVLNRGEVDQFHVRQMEDVHVRNSSQCSIDDLDCSQSDCDFTEDVLRRAVLPQPRLFREDGTLSNRYLARMEQNTPKSRAKVFGFMTDRENKNEPQKDLCYSRTQLNFADDVHQLRGAPRSKTQNVGEIEDPASGNTYESVSAEVPSDVEHSENVAQIPAVKPPSVLLEDPLLLASPKVCIPKRQQAAFSSKWPINAKIPSDSVIYLKKWCLREIKKGLYVDGIHCSENIRWNSNVVVERMSKTVLKTVSGRIYILVGRLMRAGSSDFPQWFLKKFAYGFPSNWKTLFEKFRSESRNCRNQSGGRRKNSDERCDTDNKKPEASSVRAARKKPLTPVDPKPPLSSAKVSRSGRLVIPPLDYWRGGRVVLDPHNNVTVHECYDTSIVIPTAATTQPACPSEAPVHLPLTGEKDVLAQGPARGRRARNPPATSSRPAPASVQSKSSKEESAAPQKPKGSNRRKVGPKKPEAPVKTKRRGTTSSKSCAATEQEPEMSNVPQQQGAGKSSTQTSKQQKSNNPSTTANRTRRNNLKSQETVGDIHESLQNLTSDEDLTLKTKRQRRPVQTSRGRKVQSRAPTDPDLSEEDVEEPRKKRNAAQTKAKSTSNKCPPTQSGRKQKAKKGKPETQQDPDEDEWTEEELKKLQQAVSYYPRHIVGYWERVAAMVETRSAEECHSQHTAMETSQQQPEKGRRKKVEALKAADMKKSDLSSDEDLTLKTKRQRRPVQTSRGRKVQSRAPTDPDLSEEDVEEPRKKRNAAQTKVKSTSNKCPTTQSGRKQKAKKGKPETQQDPDEDEWTEEELKKLQQAVSYYPRHIVGYWERVAAMVETRSAEECHSQHTAMETSQQQPEKGRRKKVEAPKAAGVPLISARVGTLKRKQQVRQFLEAMPREDVEDAFSSTGMRNKCFQIHTLGQNEDRDIMLSELEPLTPRSCFPEARTPQCLHLTPGMMDSPNGSKDDKYAFHLQKRMKKSRFDAQKRSRASKKFTPTPSVRRPLRRWDATAGNDSFVVWEMFSGKDTASPDDSEEEEEDFYFSDTN